MALPEKLNPLPLLLAGAGVLLFDPNEKPLLGLLLFCPNEKGAGVEPVAAGADDAPNEKVFVGSWLSGSWCGCRAGELSAKAKCRLV